MRKIWFVPERAMTECNDSNKRKIAYINKFRHDRKYSYNISYRCIKNYIYVGAISE